MRKLIKTKIYLLLVLINSVVAFGTAGYMIIAGYSFFDALYMTIITITTTGFGEVVPLNSSGRAFTMVLLIITLGVVAYSLASISAYIIDGDFMVLLRKKRVRNTVRKMENHVILCGYGRNGKKAAEMFSIHNIPYVVIENNHDEAMRLRESDIPVLEENALDDEVLLAAGILKARALLCSLSDDTDNLYIVLSAKALNKNLVIISRASNESVEKKLKIAGATDVVKPANLGGSHMAHLIINPGINEFMHYITNDPETMFKEVELKHYQKLWGKPLRDIRKHIAIDISIVGLKDKNGEYLVNPTSDTLLENGQQLIIMATQDQLVTFNLHFS